MMEGAEESPTPRSRQMSVAGWVLWAAVGGAVTSLSIVPIAEEHRIYVFVIVLPSSIAAVFVAAWLTLKSEKPGSRKLSLWKGALLSLLIGAAIAMVLYFVLGAAGA